MGEMRTREQLSAELHAAQQQVRARLTPTLTRTLTLTRSLTRIRTLT